MRVEVRGGRERGEARVMVHGGACGCGCGRRCVPVAGDCGDADDVAVIRTGVHMWVRLDEQG